ncbi:hypothetical protein DPEC_G00115530 [Dallia pectoralis]|uniref:Uncharacterized protein n=1 Tax=Dallia pectoralis TaxID=75939 RepID=A0ACC2GTY5_DALPE|nr:hypothetical protein DPEC_G00115530 [Dallia pectoralis]
MPLRVHTNPADSRRRLLPSQTRTWCRGMSLRCVGFRGRLAALCGSLTQGRCCSLLEMPVVVSPRNLGRRPIREAAVCRPLSSGGAGGGQLGLCLSGSSPENQKRVQGDSLLLPL